MPDTILIAGGTGLLGKALQSAFQNSGHHVRILKRGTPSTNNEFQWDPSKHWMDETSLKGVNYIINLAGSNVGEGRWTRKRKINLTESRINSTQLLINKCLELKVPIKKFIQASAIGYYGVKNNNFSVDENNPIGNDFLAKLTGKWEAETDRLNNSGIPLMLLRIGVVLTGKGGALPPMAKPVKMFLGMSIGSGEQFISWIHIDDVIGFIEFSLSKPEVIGVYNLVSPEPVKNKQFMKELCRILRKPFWPISVPSWGLRLIMGEQAEIVTGGCRVSCNKLLNSGYIFRYPSLEEALRHELTQSSQFLKEY